MYPYHIMHSLGEESALTVNTQGSVFMFQSLSPAQIHNVSEGITCFSSVCFMQKSVCEIGVKIIMLCLWQYTNRCQVKEENIKS